jgi:ABC-type uncharacterized transport system ATPase subunit
MSYDKEAAERKLDFSEMDIITLQEREQRLEIDGKGNTIMPSDQYMEIRDKYCELIQMIKDGKLIMIPCNVGDTVTAEVVRPYNNHTITIQGEVIGIMKRIVIRVQYDSDRTIDFYDTDFGKTVFVTPKENQDKLKEC